MSENQLMNMQTDECKNSYEALRKDYDELVLKSAYHEQIGTLAAGIAHEIRNPLTTVKGFLQLIQPFLAQIEKEEYAKIALKEIDRANEILYEFLNAVKPSSRVSTSIDVNHLLREIELLYESEAKLRNIILTIKYDTENPFIYMDEKQLKQVLINMIKNSIEAIDSRHQGRIELSSEISGKYVNIIIKDNGCGLPEDAVQSIFTPFFTTKSEGTGLGLPICKKIIDESGGQINISSRLGEGTMIKIELPLCTEFKLNA
ncbi:two-component system sensor histidine kinase NtrB [Bacillus dakarensis]|uniref:two-component system sensor histidine kinase NtrB n=1 Tax=Robertmurraya dakarensis TaxID=1926278 RepID=UPI000981F2ED|nr:ATP-binding protein [Bacillus dakarensis]